MNSPITEADSQLLVTVIAEFELDAPVVRVCGEDVPMPYAANLEKLALPQLEGIVAAVKSIV